MNSSYPAWASDSALRASTSIVGLLDDVLDENHHAAGALVRLHLRHRRRRRGHGGARLLAHLHQRLLAIERLEFRERLLQDGLRRALVGHSNLEFVVRGFALAFFIWTSISSMSLPSCAISAVSVSIVAFDVSIKAWRSLISLFFFNVWTSFSLNSFTQKSRSTTSSLPSCAIS